MVKKKLLTPGTKLEVYQGKKDDKKTWVSQLEYVEDNVLYISMPISQGYTVPLTPNSIVKIVFVKDSNSYFFKAKVMQNIWDKIPKIKLIFSSEIRKIQRRRFFRLPTLLPVEIFIEPEKKSRGIIEDISGGGVRLSCNKNLPIGIKLLLKFELKGFGQMEIQGEVVRKDQNEKQAKYSYSCGINFVDISEKQRDIIVKFIFEEQRKLRSRGLI